MPKFLGASGTGLHDKDQAISISRALVRAPCSTTQLFSSPVLAGRRMDRTRFGHRCALCCGWCGCRLSGFQHPGKTYNNKRQKRQQINPQDQKGCPDQRRHFHSWHRAPVSIRTTSYPQTTHQAFGNVIEMNHAQQMIAMIHHRQHPEMILEKQFRQIVAGVISSRCYHRRNH